MRDIKMQKIDLCQELERSYDQPSLLTALGPNYSREIFRAARVGDSALLEKMIRAQSRQNLKEGKTE